MSKIGSDREYDTIDRCITKESRSREYRSNGLKIENQIFLIMKDAFKELYKENDDGWINKLNQKILDNRNLENNVAFINYNYDKVLDENLLHFDYLTEKERDVDYRDRRQVLQNHTISTFYPHGNLFPIEEVRAPSHISRHLRTNKTGLKGVIDAISCHESDNHQVFKYGFNPIKLYILGLGGGLRVNLSNLDFGKEKISEIHVTVTDKNKYKEIISLLSEKYAVPTTDVRVYPACDELVEKAFNGD